MPVPPEARHACTTEIITHLFHTEVFVVPRSEPVSLDQLERLRDRIDDLDWKLHDVVIAPVSSLPASLTRSG